MCNGVKGQGKKLKLKVSSIGANSAVIVASITHKNTMIFPRVSLIFVSFCREEIGITLGNTGSIISISYKPLASPLAPPCHELKPLSEASKERQFAFKTAVSHSTAKTGMSIPSVLPSTKPVPGYKWIKRLKNSSPGSDAGNTYGNGEAGAEDGAGFDPEGKDIPENHSFLRKYWYVVLPVTIMTLMGPEEPDAGGAGAGAKAAAPAVAAGASAAAASGAGKKRRGKRG